MKAARWAGRGLLALVAALLAVNVVGVVREIDELRPVGAGDLAPAFALPQLEAGGELGAPVTLESLRGKVVLLDFWATWCGPCKRSMPMVERLHQRFAERGLVTVSINTEGPDAHAAARAMLDELAPSSIGLADDGRVADRYRVTTIPHMVVVGRDGVVHLVHRGFAGATAAERDLVAEIEALL